MSDGAILQQMQNGSSRWPRMGLEPVRVWVSVKASPGVEPWSWQRLTRNFCWLSPTSQHNNHVPVDHLAENALFGALGLPRSGLESLTVLFVDIRCRVLVRSTSPSKDPWRS